MPKPFDIDFEFLPPHLQLKLWVLALDADTSSVALAYNPGAFKSSLSFDYDGKLQAAFGYRRLTTTLAYKTDSKDVSLGLVYRGYNFSATAGASAGASGPGLGLGFTYGAPLLPFPTQLAGTFNQAGAALGSMAGGLGTIGSNPLQYYKLHSDDISTIKNAVDLGQKIAKSNKGPQFGAAFGLNYAPGPGLTITLGAGVTF